MIDKLLIFIVAIFALFLIGMNIYMRQQVVPTPKERKFDKSLCGEKMGSACFKTAIDNGVSTAGANKACGNWETREYMIICERILSETS